MDAQVLLEVVFELERLGALGTLELAQGGVVGAGGSPGTAAARHQVLRLLLVTLLCAGRISQLSNASFGRHCTLPKRRRSFLSRRTQSHNESHIPETHQSHFDAIFTKFEIL